MRWIPLLFMMVTAGCASYITPGGPVSLPSITDADVAEALAREPAATFPARIAVTRVQGRDYKSKTNEGYGSGAFTVLTNRDVETEADFERLGKLPEVAAVTALTRILLPATSFQSTKELRTAAAQLRADLLFIYTFDTAFKTDKTQIGPLAAVGLGYFPTRDAQVTSTCSGAFLDVRTGFVFGTFERTAKEEQSATVWGTEDAIDEARRNAERQAFVDMLGEIEAGWSMVVDEGTHPR